MSSSGDDTSVTRRELDDRSADALLSGRAVEGEPDLAALLGTMGRLAAVAPPAPSDALAAVLDAGLTAEQLGAAPAATYRSAAVRGSAVSWRAVSWRTARPWRQVSVAGAACLGLVLSAAAANALPAPAQTAVADAVDAVTPLHLPRPARPAPVPAATPSSTPTPAPTDLPTAPATHRPAPLPVVTPHQGDGHHDGNELDGNGGDGTGDRQGGDAPKATRAPDDSTRGGSSDERDEPRATTSPTPEPRESDGGTDGGGSGSDSGSGGSDGGRSGSSLSGSEPSSAEH